MKKRIHITIPRFTADALEAIAKLEGRSLSDIIEQLAREELKGRGVLHRAEADEILSAMKKEFGGQDAAA